MTLKWLSAIVAAASAGSFATVNILLGRGVPVAANLVLVAVATAAVLAVIVAEVYERLDARIGVLSEFLVARLDEMASRLDRLEADLHTPPAPSTVVPLAPRRTRR